MAEESLLVGVLGRRRSAILLTGEGIWIPSVGQSGARAAPDLAGMMLGSSVSSRRETTEIGDDPEFSEILKERDPREARQRLESVATKVPYSMIVRCYLARPGRYRRSKLAFEAFDERSTALVSWEFHVAPECVEALEKKLGSLIPDRLEIH